MATKTIKFWFASFYCSLAVSVAGYCQEPTVNSYTFGPIVFGENRLPLSLQQVKFEHDMGDFVDDAKFVEKSLQWIRVDNLMILPRARFQFTLKADPKDLVVEYQNKSFVFQELDGKAFFDIFVPLFSPGSLDVYVKGKYRGSFKFNIDTHGKGKRKLIDYSCSNYDLQINGIDNEYLSVGCYMARTGTFGEEKSTLEIHWAAPNLHLANDAQPPYVFTLQPNMPAKFTVIDHTNHEHVVEFKASFGERNPRLRTALGLGPYIMSGHEGDSQNPGLPAPGISLYGKFELSDATSLRFFEAYMQRVALFNNFGIYYAYDVGAGFDRRFLVSLNLGFQGVHFRQGSGGHLDDVIIFPQGIEMTYRHAFGLQNYHLVFGTFIPTSIQEDYHNIWLRFGKRVFTEWNYLSWSKDDRFVQAWGLSVGFPFISLL